MSEAKRPFVSFEDTAAMTAAVRRGVRIALLAHARAGNPVAFSRNGKVVWVQPDEVFALLAAADADALTPES